MADKDKEIVDRLDTIIAILNLAFAGPIQSARDKIQKDPVNAAILDALALGAVPAGELQEMVKKATGQSVRSILAALAEQRVLERIGSGPKTSYRATGPLAVPVKKLGTTNRVPTDA
jgi:hypothetical protein